MKQFWVRRVRKRIGSTYVGNVVRRDILIMSMGWVCVKEVRVFYAQGVWVRKYQVLHNWINSLIWYLIWLRVQLSRYHFATAIEVLKRSMPAGYSIIRIYRLYGRRVGSVPCVRERRIITRCIWPVLPVLLFRSKGRISRRWVYSYAWGVLTGWKWLCVSRGRRWMRWVVCRGVPMTIVLCYTLRGWRMTSLHLIVFIARRHTSVIARGIIVRNVEWTVVRIVRKIYGRNILLGVDR